MKVTHKPLTAARWKDIEKLFGPRGASAGCWCMWWRREKGERWEDNQGDPNKRRFRSLVRRGRVSGVLAYVGGEAVGWCQYGPRLDFPALERARTLACDDPERVWSINCLFIARGYRRQGIAEGLIAAAIERMRSEGAEIAEAYPVKVKRGKEIPEAFAYTGLVPSFRRLGFRAVGTRSASRQRMRLAL